MHEMSRYELKPELDTKKSFYGKAFVSVYEDGSKILSSYGDRTVEYNNGKLYRLSPEESISVTAFRHAREFAYQETGNRDFTEDDYAELPFKEDTSLPELKNLEIDKANLVAKGSVEIAGITGNFTYDMYSGKCAVASEKGDIATEGDIENIRIAVMDGMFPLVGTDTVRKLLSQVGTKSAFTNGLVNMYMDISASDILMQLDKINREDQVLRLYNGDLAVLKNNKDHFAKTIFKRNGGSITSSESFKTFSDAARTMTRFFHEVNDEDKDRFIGYVKSRENRMIRDAMRSAFDNGMGR